MDHEILKALREQQHEATAAPEHFDSARLQRADVRNARVDSPADILRCLEQNEERVASIVESIMENFCLLSQSSRDLLMSGIPAHWTGERYPLYDSLRRVA